jgi:hypothetical protein
MHPVLSCTFREREAAGDSSEDEMCVSPVRDSKRATADFCVLQRPTCMALHKAVAGCKLTDSAANKYIYAHLFR